MTNHSIMTINKVKINKVNNKKYNVFLIQYVKIFLSTNFVNLFIYFIYFINLFYSI
jgi:hypothetical protein